MVPMFKKGETYVAGYYRPVSLIWIFYIILEHMIATLIIKVKLRSFKSSEHINEKRNGPYRGFGYLSLFSDPLDLAKWSQREYCTFATFNRIVDANTSFIQTEPNIKKRWLENESKPILNF